MWNHGWGSEYGWGMGWGWFAAMHAFWWVLVLVVVVLLYRAWRADRTEDRRNALDILRQRYARGEIDEAEYARRKKILME